MAFLFYMTIPDFLKPGDEVIVVGPAKRLQKKPIDDFRNFFSGLGFKVILDDHLFREDGFFAGDDTIRLAALQRALDSDRYKAVICARGGYGITRIIDQLDLTGIISYPKWLVGFSDITALLCLLDKSGLASVHGSMPGIFNVDSKDHCHSFERLAALLTGSLPTFNISADHANIQGKANGVLVGGNLSILVNQIKTNSEPILDSKILFIEEVDEYLYAIDRMLVHMKRSGLIENLSGVVVGQFSYLKDGDTPFGKTIEQIILSHFTPLEIPVAFDFPFGHADLNLPIPLGVEAELDVGDHDTKLTFKI